MLDLRGHKYGRLTPISKTPNGKWKCLCDCGNTTCVCTGDLRRKHKSIKSCGCLKAELCAQRQFRNLSGRRFGRLVPIKRLPNKNNNDKYVWECRCDCGNAVYPTTGSLLSGNSKSCGCYARDRASEVNTTHGQSKTLEYNRLKCRKRRARKNKVINNWEPEMESLLRTMFSRCAVCGITQDESIETYNESLHIDHVFPLDKGYGLLYDNVCLLCRHCNSSKGTKLLDELPIDYALKIVTDSVKFQLAWEGHTS